ncbi:MAG: sodium/glutamate symporter [Dongiales bacterium]
MPLAHMVELSALATLILALVTLFIGKGVRAGVPWLKRISLPDEVVGGLLVALLVLILHIALALDLRFDKAVRDLLLLIFFATIGLSAKLRMLATGGRPLLILCLAILLLIFLQNLVGAAVALAFGAHPFYGLLAGGLSFVGGPGTALAWAREAEAAGLEAAPAVGIGAATLATIAGALFAGPISGFLISRHGLRPPDRSPSGISFAAVEQPPVAALLAPMKGLEQILLTLLMVAVAVYLGKIINGWAAAGGVMLPGFLTAMLAGIALTNAADALRWPLDLQPVAMGGEIALNLFLAISLMGTPLLAIAAIIGPLLLNTAVQILLILAVAYFVVFRLLGRDYDAAVTTAGFLGFGLASMPVAMATMDEVARRYGPSPKAFLVITLAGAFFVDLANASVAKLFLLLPMFRLG